MVLLLMLLIIISDVHLCSACNDIFRDVGIILDVSGSMYPKRMVEARKFISEFIKIANFTKNGSHGALTIFSSKSVFEPHEMLKIKFSEQLDLDDYLEAVDRITQADEDKNRGTNIIYALDVSLSKMFQTNSGMRQDAIQVAVLITDGDDRAPESAYEERAKMFNERKIRVLVVAVGDVAREVLSKLVESPEHFFKAEKFEDLLDNVTEIIGALICEDPVIGPCPKGYTMIDGHVNQLASEFERVNATNEECKEMCNNDTTCVSFEFCHYWCDEELGPPSKNHCIINYKNFPQSAMPRSFFRCSKDCPGQFSKAEALYCDKDCGANWLDNQYGCQISDADAYCRLKHCNENATAKKFDILPAKVQPGFACQGIGMRFERRKNGTIYSYHGILDFNYVDDIKNTHGEGNVITNVMCVNRSNDCVWSEWKDTDCSVTCGVGEKIRRRYARIPANFEAGGTCDDSFKKTIRCDTLIPCKRYGCVDGDVQLTRDNFPQIYRNQDWRHICPFQFTDNHYGVDLFCRKFGLNLGGTTRRIPEEYQKFYMPVKYYDSVLVGTCKPTDTWPDCSIDCNIQNLGGGCSTKEYFSGNQTKMYYVCRKEQHWLFTLHCNGAKDLPLSSCYDIKKTRPETSTEKCDTESAIAAKIRIVDDQRPHSTSLKLRTQPKKSTNAGSPTLSINLFTIVMLIITSQLN